MTTFIQRNGRPLNPRRTAGVALSGVALAGLAAFTPAVAATAPGSAPAQSARAGTSQAQPMPTGSFAYAFGASLAELPARQLEKTFLGSIIPHHEHAIAMARLELARGKSPDIRTHAENIIASQQHQVMQFTTWLKSWYGLTPEQARDQAPAKVEQQIAAMDKEMTQMMSQLEAVPAGPGFDVAFVKHMIPHHTSGVIEFLEPQSRAVHAQLRVAATTGAMSQEAEIADFRTWLSGH